MKRYILLVSVILCTVTACKKNKDIEVFDANKSYVYFAVPNPSNSSAKVENYLDSLNFSFVFEAIGLKTKRLGIPLNIIGTAKDHDRKVAYKINAEKTTINLTDIQIEEPLVRSGKTTDSLFVNINKADALRQGVFYLTLDLQDNDEFKVGHKSNKQIRVSITNMLTKPAWWDKWKAYFGTTYYQEVYQMWIQMYPLGVDPSPDIYGVYPAPYYYWNNMPTAATVATYPVTFMYIAKLRDYFLTNVVYPNGDSTQPRILLP